MTGESYHSIMGLCQRRVERKSSHLMSIVIDSAASAFVVIFIAISTHSP